LRRAARKLNGLIIPAGQVFSFWKNVGRATRARGFVAGRELREGCVIPNIGGGLCQLSNALYDVALRANCEIVERHAHTQRLPGSATLPGRDATVFWNYVDLRFRPLFDCQLQVSLSRSELVVRLVSLNAKVPELSVVPPIASGETRPEVAETCETCGVVKCFRNSAAASLPRRGVTAWLLDKWEPEFDEWIQKHRESSDIVLIPLQSRSHTGYRWNTTGFDAVRQAPIVTLRRSLGSRRLSSQGAERQRALLGFDRALAEAYAGKLTHLADHVVVSQNLLPHLWQRGDLGGRTFDVLMTRLPIGELQKVLDRAARLHPESTTLGDFRASSSLRDAEEEALAAARWLITPHSYIAALNPDRTIKLEWSLPAVASGNSPNGAIAFPATTLGRKGCYEMREIARETNLPVHLGGPVLEKPDFWHDIRTQRLTNGSLEHAGLIILPAWVEHWPRKLLRAAAAGVPVIASTACGLSGVPNVIEFPIGNAGALRNLVAGKFHRIDA
jgi:hypothetical protein